MGGASSKTSFESQIRTKTGDTLVSVLSRLPEVWSARRRARRLAGTLPDYEFPVPTPDSATIYSWIEELCATRHRRPGTPEGRRAESWVADKLRDLGIADVAMDPIPITVWSADTWSLSVNGHGIPCFFVVNTAFTAEEGTSAPLVYVGTGTPNDFEANDVAGRIVVADVTFPTLPTGLLMKLMRGCYLLSDPDHSLSLGSQQRLNFARQNFLGGDTAESAPQHDVYWQAVRRGATGICLILRDQPTNSNTHYGPYDGIMKPIPGVWVGKQDGHRLRELAREGARAALVLTGKTEEGVTHNVWGTLPGRSTAIILVTSHHDSPFQGATEDGSGVAQVLAQAWTWSRVPEDQRAKTMVFVVDAGHFYGSIGAETFTASHKDIIERARILITPEHLAAKEVEEREDRYVPTGRLATTVMFTTPDPTIIASVMKALATKPAKVTASIPADFFGPGPTSDASPYVLDGGVPVISWIGCPYYLLDEHDTLDKIDKNELGPICETVTELVKTYMAAP